MKRTEQQALDKIIQDNMTYQLTETEFGNIFAGEGLENKIILTNTTTISNLTGKSYCKIIIQNVTRFKHRLYDVRKQW